MSDHSSAYWSIGEVLSLLQDEFPEVTISKIRFLESQGLIDPERTPSGYRRFYQEDFDRLQWILTQQRDHYLPLKVIRDRLDAGEWERPEHPEPAERKGQMNLLAPVIDIRPGSDRTDHASAGSEPGPDATASDHSAVDRSASDHSASDHAAVDRSASDRSAADRSAAERSAAERSATERSAAENSGTDSSAADAGSDAEASSTTANRDAAAPPATDRRDPDERPSAVAMETVSEGVALTIDEIAESAGCDVAMIRELERFGLVAGRTVGPTVLYDGEALTIARHATQFRNFGLDPRHLRTFRVGAEREVALLAQVVEPLRHRRDPETRRKSAETMDDLLDLGASLRAILMRQITREQLPPS